MESIPATCDEMRGLIGEFLKRGDSEAQRLWDIITCQRGPDAPSEVGGGADQSNSEAYNLRRERKRDTVEVIRAQSWNGVVGGCARYRTDIKYVTVEPPSRQDHFARHVVKAASALGLEIKYKKDKKGEDPGVVVEPYVNVGKKQGVTIKETPGGGANVFYENISSKPPVTKLGLGVTYDGTFVKCEEYNFYPWSLEVKNYDHPIEVDNFAALSYQNPEWDDMIAVKMEQYEGAIYIVKFDGSGKFGNYVGIQSGSPKEVAWKMARGAWTKYQAGKVKGGAAGETMQLFTYSVPPPSIFAVQKQATIKNLSNLEKAFLNLDPAEGQSITITEDKYLG